MGQTNAHREWAATMTADETENPLRIAGVDPERGFAGGETQVLGLTRELLRRGHRAELICNPAGRLIERARAEGITCHPLALRNAIDIAGALRLRSVLARGNYDVVHFHTSRAHAMAPFARGLARALVVTRRMDYRPNRLFAPYLYTCAVDGVAAISEGVAAALADAGVGREHVTIIPSGVDCDYFRPPSACEREDAREKLGIARGAVAVGCVGMLEERKGHRYLVDAIARVDSSILCLIAGDGSQRQELERQSASSDMAGRIRFLGRMEDVRPLLWALDIFMFPSLLEGLGVAAIEAAACGLPTVATHVGGIAEVVADQVSGILVAPRDAAALAAAIERLRQSPEERSALGCRARARAVDKFAMKAMAEQTLALYRACLPGRKDRR